MSVACCHLYRVLMVIGFWCWVFLFFVHHRYIQSTCATSGEGLYEGLDWLSNNIANKVGHKFFISYVRCLTCITLVDFCLLFWIRLRDIFGERCYLARLYDYILKLIGWCSLSIKVFFSTLYQVLLLSYLGVWYSIIIAIVFVSVEFLNN